MIFFLFNKTEKEVKAEFGHNTLKFYEQFGKKAIEWMILINQRAQTEPDAQIVKSIAIKRGYIDFNKSQEVSESFLEFWSKIQLISKSPEISSSDFHYFIDKMVETQRDYKRSINRLNNNSFTEQDIIKMKKDYFELLNDIYLLAKEKYPDQVITVSEKDLQEQISNHVDYIIKNNLINQFIKMILNIIYPLIQLFCLSVITQAHVYTRYSNVGFNPLEFYTPKKQIIKKYLILNRITNASLKSLDMLYSYLDPLQNNLQS